MIRAWVHSIATILRRLRNDVRGGVALIGALALTSIVGMGAFAVEVSQGYAARASNQRIADMAALAGALAYNVNSSTSEMTATAKAVVAAQGLAASAATVSLVTDAATSKQLVQVTVTTSVPLSLARVLTSALSYDVQAVGSATTSTTTTTTPPCISTLHSATTTGVVLSGGVSISAPNCAINSNGRVEVPWGTYITAKQVVAASSVINPGSGITTTPTANNIQANKAGAASDWMQDNSSLKAMLCAVNKLTGTSDADYADGNTVCTTPLATVVAQTSTSTQDWNTGYVALSGIPHIYQTSAYSCQYNIPAGNYDLRDVTINGGCSMTFATGSTVKIRNLNMSGSGMTMGDGDFTVTGTFGFNSGSLITIGNGNHYFGSLNVTGGRTLRIGSGDLTVNGSITEAGGSYIYIATGVGQTVTIGGSSGTAINIGGGSFLCFTPASGSNCSAPTAAAGTFSANGQVVTSGGSTIAFPKASTHVINGALSLNGSSTFGSGTYYINGNFTNNTGGTMSGSNVSFALSGTFTLSGGTSLDLAAPSSSGSYGVPGILIATKSTSATSIGGGSQNKYAGLVYAPKSDMTVSGGAALSSNGTNCLMLILKTLTLSGGTTVASTCSSLSTSGPVANVALFK
jgi:Flp pilus assembly protein TadG